MSSTRRRAAAAGLLAIAALVSAAGCASRRSAARHFAPARADDIERALDAWGRAVARASSLPPSRILYDVKIRQGIGSISGTLAVSTGEPVHATISGPFGSPLAIYEDGALRGEKFAPVVIEPEPLLWLLAGVWKGSPPKVRGVEGTDALLAWEGGTAVEGVLDVAAARFTSIRVARGRAAFAAEYSGAIEPWPSRVNLEDLSTSNRMILTLQAREPLR